MPITNKCDSLSHLAPDVYKSARKTLRNTFNWTDSDGSEHWRLHKTDIVVKDRKGRYTLNSGGWRTMTTKDRMNNALRGYCVISIKGLWHVRRGDWHTGESVPYFDGIVIPDAFEKPAAKAKAEKKQAAEKKTIAKINAFTKPLLTMETLPMPSAGDCWLCLLQDKDGHAKRSDCALSHVKENYLHGSLLVLAMRLAGYRDTGIGFYLQSKPSNRWQRQRVLAALRKYLKHAYSVGAVGGVWG